MLHPPLFGCKCYLLVLVQVGYRHIDCSPQYGNQKEVSCSWNLKPDIPATWQAMEKLYDSGKARAIGVSNFSCKKLEDLLNVARVPPAVNQVECHPVWQQGKLRKLCQSKGVHLSVSSNCIKTFLWSSHCLLSISFQLWSATQHINHLLHSDLFSCYSCRHMHH